VSPATRVTTSAALPVFPAPTAVAPALRRPPVSPVVRGSISAALPALTAPLSLRTVSSATGRSVGSAPPASRSLGASVSLALSCSRAVRSATVRAVSSVKGSTICLRAAVFPAPFPVSPAMEPHSASAVRSAVSSTAPTVPVSPVAVLRAPLSPTVSPARSESTSAEAPAPRARPSTRTV
jgi:hypothetical protein